MRIVIVDDQRLVREGLAELLGSSVEVVGMAGDGRAGLGLCRALRPDVALVDVVMPRLDGPGLTRALTEEGSPTRVLAITTYDTDEHVFAMLAAGASGFVLKDTRPDELVRALQLVASGEALLAPSVTRRMIERFGRPGRRLPEGTDAPTPREREVLHRIARGLSNEEIAGELGMGVATVKTHVHNLLGKLGCRDRAQLVIAAYEAGVIRPGDGSSPGA
jgi:DNA-binding NarL/FixJ family response regulator